MRRADKRAPRWRQSHATNYRSALVAITPRTDIVRGALKSENGGWIEQHLLITRYDTVRAARDEMRRVEDVLEFLAISLLGVIPASQEVIRASTGRADFPHPALRLGSPVTLNNKRSAAARAYNAAAK